MRRSLTILNCISTLSRSSSPSLWTVATGSESLHRPCCQQSMQRFVNASSKSRQSLNQQYLCCYMRSKTLMHLWACWRHEVNESRARFKSCADHYSWGDGGRISSLAPGTYSFNICPKQFKHSESIRRSLQVRKPAISLLVLGCMNYFRYYPLRLRHISYSQFLAGKYMLTCSILPLLDNPPSRLDCPELMEQDVEDLELDVPHVLDLLTLFVARAVTDDILPPSFVSHTKGKMKDFLPLFCQTAQDTLSSAVYP